MAKYYLIFELLAYITRRLLAHNLCRGINKVPIRVITSPAILPSLTSIINATFEFSTFPLAWKTAGVSPLPKVGDHDIPNNNRSISPLPAFSKVCERVAHDQFRHICSQEAVYHSYKAETNCVIHQNVCHSNNWRNLKRQWQKEAKRGCPSWFK